MKKPESLRLLITKTILKRHFIDEFQDIGELIIEVEKIVNNELKKAQKNTRNKTITECADVCENHAKKTNERSFRFCATSLRDQIILLKNNK